MKSNVNSSPKFNGKCYSVVKLSTWQGTVAVYMIMFVKPVGELAILLFAVDTSKTKPPPRGHSVTTPQKMSVNKVSAVTQQFYFDEREYTF